jgi:hypothetical protein
VSERERREREIERSGHAMTTPASEGSASDEFLPVNANEEISHASFN